MGSVFSVAGNSRHLAGSHQAPTRLAPGYSTNINLQLAIGNKLVIIGKYMLIQKIMLLLRTINSSLIDQRSLRWGVAL